MVSPSGSSLLCWYVFTCSLASIGALDCPGPDGVKAGESFRSKPCPSPSNHFKRPVLRVANGGYLLPRCSMAIFLRVGLKLDGSSPKYTLTSCLDANHKNKGIVFAYRFHSLRGSCNNRYSHSRPFFLTQAGAHFCAPAKTGKTQPIPIMTAFTLFLWAVIQRSCFGQPNDTNTIPAPLLLSRWIRASSSS